MNKEKYFELSKASKLPLRCPCLSNCSRYRFTAYFIGKTCYKIGSDDIELNMKNMQIIGNSEEISKMLEAGEPVTFVGGNRCFHIKNACPEFFLHPHQHKLHGMQDLAVHEYFYDELYSRSKFITGESRHYSECPEFCLFQLTKRPLATRRKIPQKIKAELQKEVASKCPKCGNNEVGHFQVHHIDENKENNSIRNLIMLCAICHSKVTKGDISRTEIKNIKSYLIQQSMQEKQ